MEIQDKILKEISIKSKELIQNEIVSYINNLVDLKLGKEKEKFYDETNILGDIFPKLENGGFCGKCRLCNKDSEYYKLYSDSDKIYYNEKWKEECSISSYKISEQCKLYDDEYIILCSRRYNGDQNNTHYYTNYGRLCFIQSNSSEIWIYTSDRGGNNHVMYGNDGVCGGMGGCKIGKKRVNIKSRLVDNRRTRVMRSGRRIKMKKDGTRDRRYK